MTRTETQREAERRRVRDWTAALDALVESDGAEAARRLLAQLERRAALAGVRLPRAPVTPYLNTIAADAEPAYPGDAELDARLEALARWNAAMIVVRANRRSPGLGGHIATYASAATLFEVGFQHAFEARDRVFFQGHASPGVYARAFLEGRLSQAQLDNFRRELQPGGGLPSYPHPWLMPDFWEFPSVSMGLAPLMAIYQARFDRYLQARGLAEETGRVWALVGDGEMDEPESLGGLSIAAREGLGNLVLVVNANLQRLDGPVRGNGKIVQELESLFAGAGWHVVKVLWNGAWDRLLERDVDGRLARRLERTVDGEWQRWAARGPGVLREELFGSDPALAAMVEDLDEAELAALGRGGHDRRKVAAAYAAARDETERPTVVLAQTVKGRGLGEAGEALNVAHKTKDLDVEALAAMRDELCLPIPDGRLGEAPLYRPSDDAPEMESLRERREALGGPLPRRRVRAAPIEPPDEDVFAPFLEATDGEATTTTILVRLLSRLVGDETLGRRIVPIVPDEARTFGLEALFPKIGIYAPGGQRYEPVDADTILTYRERADGQILEEGITEAGSMSSFIAAGTAHATQGVVTIPFYFFYSMFGLQRVGDLIWAAGDSRARGFLVGATSGRTTLNGEGLQHQDGHSHLAALGHPTLRAYDPAFGYEVAVLVEDGLRRMFAENRDEMVYLSVHNEPFEHPALPDGAREGIVRGLYRLRASDKSGEVRRVRLLASGPLVRHALGAQRRLEERGVTADVWSVTSWQQLHRDAAAADRESRLRPEREPRASWLERCLGDDDGPIVAVSDFSRALADVLAPWMPGRLVALGTDGFGRSDERAALRDFFEIDERWITLAALAALARDDRIPEGWVMRAREELGIDPDKPDPSTL